MRLLYYSESYGPHDHRLLETFSDSGWTTFFCTQKKKSDFTEQAPLPSRVRWKQIKSPADLAKTLQSEKIELMLAGPLHSCAYDAALTGFHPWMAISWAYDLLHLAKGDKKTAVRVKIALGSTDHFFCDSQTVLNEAAKYRAFKKTAIIQIPWGIPPVSPGKKPDRSLRKKLGWEKAVVWICNRGWAPIYNPLTVLEAFSQAVKENPSLRLILAGGGVMQERVKRWIKEKKLSEKVHCPGYLNPTEMTRCLQASDFYLSASSCDGTSISMLEAMSCGLPVLLSDIPSNREWVQENKNGRLFPLNNVKELSAQILEMSALSVVSLKRMGGNNRKLVSQRANWLKNRKLLIAGCKKLPEKYHT